MTNFSFNYSEVILLGHIANSAGVKADLDKIKDDSEAPTSKNVTELSVFLGLFRYYRRLISNFTGISAVFYAVTFAKNYLKGTEEMQDAFKGLK